MSDNLCIYIYIMYHYILIRKKRESFGRDFMCNMHDDFQNQDL